jgi:hypothetical protein
VAPAWRAGQALRSAGSAVTQDGTSAVPTRVGTTDAAAKRTARRGSVS